MDRTGNREEMEFGLGIMDQHKQLKEAEESMARAHLSLDLAAIDALLHEDYLILQPTGIIETKADVLQSLQTGNRHWERAGLSDLQVGIYGDMGRVTGIWSAAGINNGEPFDYQARFISIWVRVKGVWRNLAYTAEEITPKVRRG